ncbi:tRNA dihydrouridine(20/20a) synthase DusA [Gammaproteobacteria bacterium]|nr:tRNA dihydrouridine(20/20a) synthase DusA [Gammaproteobacteria bacterium]
MSSHKVCVAPMMQYTDMHDRYLLRLISKNIYLYTEMISTGSIIFGNCLDQFNFNNEEHPVAVQLGGSNPAHLAQCSRIAESYGYDEINLNVGCPSERVQKGRFGACLMLEPELVAECVYEMSKNVNVPITVKCRLGIDDRDDFEFLDNFVTTVKGAGVETFIVHARNGLLKGLSPRQNRTVPPLKYDYVYKLKSKYKDLNIIINGGITDLQQTEEHLQHVDGVMIGRASYDNPFMMSGVDSLFFNMDESDNTKLSVLNEYLDYVTFMTQQGHDLSRMLKHLFGLSKGDIKAKTFRRKVHQAILDNDIEKSRAELVELI